MAIQNRRGVKANFDPNKLLPGEWAIVSNGEAYYCSSAGVVKKVATIEELQALLNSSAEAYTALQQLIADLELNPSELTNILSNISALQTGYGNSLVASDQTFDTLKDRLDNRDSQLAEIAINVETFPLIIPEIDDTARIQRALAAAKVTKSKLNFGSRIYTISDTLEIDSPVHIIGTNSGLQHGTVLLMTANKPLFDITSTCAFGDFTIQGSSNAAYTLQDGMLLTDVNNVSVKNVTFIGCYNNVHIDGTVFYTAFDECNWYSCIHAMMYGEDTKGTSTAGYAIQVNNSQVISSSGQYGFRFKNLGSVVFNTVQMSPLNLTVASLCIESLAELAGIQQFNNCGFESSSNHGIELIGTALKPIKFVFFNNCYIAGDVHAVYYDYAEFNHFNNCYFTGGILSYINHFSDGIYHNNCEYQSSVSGVLTCSSANCNSFSMDIVNPSYQGAGYFIYIPFLTPSYIKRASVIGGTIGTASTPIYLPSEAIADTVNVNIDVMGQGLNPYKMKRFTGTLGGDGATTINPNLAGLEGYVLGVFAYYNSSGVAVPLNVVSISGGTLIISGGAASAKYRVTVLYTNIIDSNW